METYSIDDDLLGIAEKQETAMRDFGLAWEHVGQIIDQIRSECTEVIEANREGDRVHLQEEVGDLLQAAISLAVFFEMDPRVTLLDSINKVQKRFDKIVDLARKDGHVTLHNQSFDVLMSYWNRAKNAES